MRVVHKNTQSTVNIEGDLMLARLASTTTNTESSEECFKELSRALEQALETIEESLKQ